MATYAWGGGWPFPWEPPGRRHWSWVVGGDMLSVGLSVRKGSGGWGPIGRFRRG